MKKLKLDLAKMKGAELLTREQLKKIVGGSETGNCSASTTCLNGSVISCSASGVAASCSSELATSVSCNGNGSSSSASCPTS